MSVLTAVLIGLAMGTVFGFALEKSRVFEPGMIVGQMQLRNFIMLKVFLTAVATGAVVLAALHGFELVNLYPKPTLYGADILGGAFLGAGIALAGACPGTVLAQVGVGYRDAIFTLLGGIAGATAFSYVEPALRPLLLSGGPGKITFAELTGIPYWVLALVLAAVLVAVLYGLETWRPWRTEMGRNVDGDFGKPQAAGRRTLKPSYSTRRVDPQSGKRMIADKHTIEALREALEDEYRARATYRKVIETFGPVRPFVNIVQAEERHANALLRQFDRLGVEPPQDTWSDRVTVPRTLAEACEAAVQAGIDNETMYERLIRQVSDPVVRRVMRRLQEASQQRHLPAFRRCQEREQGRGERTSPPFSGRRHRAGPSGS